MIFYFAKPIGDLQLFSDLVQPSMYYDQFIADHISMHAQILFVLIYGRLNEVLILNKDLRKRILSVSLFAGHMRVKQVLVPNNRVLND